jgi:uncharacterized protein YqgC (DUF456 family)
MAVIAEIADEAGADLIAAGTLGYGPLVGLLVGSVTRRLLHVSKTRCWSFLRVRQVPTLQSDKGAFVSPFIGGRQ